MYGIVMCIALKEKSLGNIQGMIGVQVVSNGNDYLERQIEAYFCDFWIWVRSLDLTY